MGCGGGGGGWEVGGGGLGRVGAVVDCRIALLSALLTALLTDALFTALLTALAFSSCCNSFSAASKASRCRRINLVLYSWKEASVVTAAPPPAERMTFKGCNSIAGFAAAEGWREKYLWERAILAVLRRVGSRTSNLSKKEILCSLNLFVK